MLPKFNRCFATSGMEDVNIGRCGTNPRIWEMTGNDADILCGEWDSNGNTDPNTSGERFNIALTIKEIVRHPDYRNNLDNEQSYLQNDIAIFKVDENALSKVTGSYCFVN